MLDSRGDPLEQAPGLGDLSRGGLGRWGAAWAAGQDPDPGSAQRSWNCRQAVGHLKGISHHYHLPRSQGRRNLTWSIQRDLAGLWRVS